MPTLPVNGTDIDFVEAGSGATVVLVHGSLQDQRYWAPQMEAFGAQYRTIALSLRHFWPARWDGDGDDFTIAQHVADLVAFIRALDAGAVRLVGHSRGGHIAFRVAEHHPELLRQLVLAEPGGELDETLGGSAAHLGQQATVFAKAATLIRAGQVDEGLRGFAEHTGGPGAWERRSEARRQVARDNATTLFGQINEQRAPYSRASVEAIGTPTLLVGGADTQPRFNAILDVMAATIAGVQRVSIPNAGHGMSADNPAAFNAAVLAFFAANP